MSEREEGTIHRVYPHGYGFIHGDSRAREEGLYFHASDVMTGPFDELMAGSRVSFVVVQDTKGPRATKVQEIGRAVVKRGRPKGGEK